MGAWRLANLGDARLWPARLLAAVLAAIGFNDVAVAADCKLPEGAATVIGEGGYRLAYTTVPPEIRAGAPFDLDLSVCGLAGAFEGALAVDADMPAHRHGMNYLPHVRMTAPGRFVADGLMFHMQGEWRFQFVLTTAEGPVRLRQLRSVE